jgi:hypothetical protein
MLKRRDTDVILSVLSFGFLLISGHRIEIQCHYYKMLRYCMFYGFLGVSRDLEINRLKVRGYL